MLSKSRFLIVTSFLFIFAATPLRAQHSEGHTPQVASGGAGSLGPATTLGSLLSVSDEAMRALDAAVDGGDRQLAERWAAAYVEAADNVAAWFDDADPTQVQRELSRAVAALGRQTTRLSELNAQTLREHRPALGSALDASRRADDALAAAREDGRSTATSAGHHRNTRRRGC